MVLHLSFGQLGQEWLQLLLILGLLGEDTLLSRGGHGAKGAEVRVVGDIEEALTALERRSLVPELAGQVKMEQASTYPAQLPLLIFRNPSCISR